MANRINSVELKNYGTLPYFKCDDFSNINLFIGGNGTGKTFILKALYSAVKTMEEYKRGDAITSVTDILSEKLRWTFQVDKLGDIVNRSAEDNLSFNMKIDSQEFGYYFSPKAVAKVGGVTELQGKKESNSIFIPAKEVLSLFSVILKSREVDMSFGFDDTYYDLAKALRIAPGRGKNYQAFANARKRLKTVIGGKVDYDEQGGKWYFKNSKKQRFSIGATSEGVKKIAITDRLFANGYLDNNSTIFIDELESALHPDAIISFLDMIDAIASKMNVQFFIASHSYFVVKKLVLMAVGRPDFVKCVSFVPDAEPFICDLSEGMPDNPIIDASIRLYEEQIMKVL